MMFDYKIKTFFTVFLLLILIYIKSFYKLKSIDCTYSLYISYTFKLILNLMSIITIVLCYQNDNES